MGESQNRVRVVIDGENNVGPAVNAAKQDLSGLGTALSSIGGLLKQLAIAEIAKKLIDFGASTLEAADNLAHMSQRTGVAVEELQAWQHAAQLAGVSSDDMEKGLRKLATTISNAAAGGAQARDALAAVGVSARNSNGQIVPISQALNTIADRFAKTKDGSEKAALAVELFGRSGTLLIPVLNGGSAGLQKMREEMVKLGGLTEQEVNEMARLSDEFKVLGQVGQGLMSQFLAGLAPELTKLFDAIARLYAPLANTGEGMSMATRAGASLGEIVNVIAVYFDGLGTAIGLAFEKLQLFVAGVGAMAKGNFADGVEKLKQMVGLAEDARAELIQASHQDFKNSVLGSGTAAGKAAPSAEELERAAKEADAIGKLRAKNQVENEKLAADFIKSLNDQAIQQLDEMLKHQLISYGAYYDQRKKLAIESAQAEVQANQAEIAAIDAALKKTKDQKIALELQGQRSALSERGTVLGESLRRLQGLDASGNPDPTAARLSGMEKAEGQAAEVGQKIDAVFADLQTKSERISFLVSSRQLTELQGEQELNDVRTDAATKLGKMVQQYQALADESGNSKLVENGKRMGEQIDELAHKTSMLRTSVIDAAQNGFENFFNTLISGTGGALKAFKNFATSVLGDIGRIISKMLAMYAVEKLVGLFLGAVSGGKGGTISDAGTINPPLGGSGVTNAAGGADVEAGQPLFVGETGEPELFVPHQSGTIVPQHRLATMGGATFVYEIDARGATPGERERMLSALRQTEDRAVARSVVAVDQMQRRRG